MYQRVLQHLYKSAEKKYQVLGGGLGDFNFLNSLYVLGIRPRDF